MTGPRLHAEGWIREAMIQRVIGGRFLTGGEGVKIGENRSRKNPAM